MWKIIEFFKKKIGKGYTAEEEQEIIEKVVDMIREMNKEGNG